MDTLSPLVAIEARYDGPIPAAARAEAQAEHRAWLARRRVRQVARTRLRARIREEIVVSAMADAIAEIHAATGGQVEERDLIRRGFTWDQIRRHRQAAKALAQPRLGAGQEIAA